MKSKFAFFIDELVLSVATWLLSAVVLLYLVSTLYMVILLATVITMAVSLLLRIKLKRNRSLMEERSSFESLEAYFLLQDSSSCLEELTCALKKRYTLTTQGELIVINKTAVCCCLNLPLSLPFAVKSYRAAQRLGAETLVIVCCRTEKLPFDLSQRLTGLRLEMVCGEMTYRLFKQFDALPQLPKPPRSKKLAGLFASALSPKRAKAYLFAVFTLLFGAYFSVLSVYYLVMGGICLTLAVLSKMDILARFRKTV